MRIYFQYSIFVYFIGGDIFLLYLFFSCHHLGGVVCMFNLFRSRLLSVGGFI